MTNNTTDKADKCLDYKTFAMGTVVSEKIYGVTADVLSEVEAIIHSVDSHWSWRNDTSIIALVNHDKKLSLNSDDLSRMEAILELARETKGAFDPTLRPLISLWGIEDDSPDVPSDEAIDVCLSNIGYEKVNINYQELSLPKDVSLDMGAVGKGLALDEIYAFFHSRNITAATVAIGGSVLTYGKKPEGTWNIAIQDPKKEAGTAMGVIHLSDTKYISTSGDYEKYFEANGVRYHHIFDRTTGYPAESDFSSVTIVCDNGTVSDGLSTACFVLGYEASLQVLKKYNADAIFIFKDGRVVLTDHIKGCFELINPDYVME